MENTNLLVTIEERRLIQKEMSVEFGTKVKYRVIDLEKAVALIQSQRDKYRMSPYIEVKPISPDMHKMPSKTGTFQKDPLTGVLYGIPIDQDDFGNMKWQKIQLGDSLSLNLDNINDARIWAGSVRFNPDVKGSPFQVQNPYYEIFDPEDIAKTEMAEVTAMKKAFERIDFIESKPVDMIMFGRYLGQEIKDNASLDIVFNTLLKFARNYPIEFNKRWESKSRSIGERLATARTIGVVTQDIDKGFVFRNIPIGLNEEDAIRFLGKDMNIMSAINDSIMEQDVLIKNLKKESDFRNKTKEDDKLIIDNRKLSSKAKTGNGFNTDDVNPGDEDKSDKNDNLSDDNKENTKQEDF